MSYNESRPHFQYYELLRLLLYKLSVEYFRIIIIMTTVVQKFSHVIKYPDVKKRPLIHTNFIKLA